MNTILFSVNNPYAELIISGKKWMELRKTRPKHRPEYALIYETKPRSAILGFCYIEDIRTYDTQEMWEYVKEGACISKDKFDKYYQDKINGFVFCLTGPIRFTNPIKLKDIGIEKPPQSYMNIDINKVIR